MGYTCYEVLICSVFDLPITYFTSVKIFLLSQWLCFPSASQSQRYTSTQHRIKKLIAFNIAIPLSPSLAHRGLDFRGRLSEPSAYGSTSPARERSRLRIA
jgi:hypothetical protein